MDQAPAVWQWSNSGQVLVGTEEHKQLFCRMLLDTYDPYKPAVIDWPTLDEAALGRLTALPFWDIAVATEAQTAARMQAVAEDTDDALLRQAIALNASEERRHKDVLENMIRFYGIPQAPDVSHPRPRDTEWAYLRTGYGECFDSFFAFGLFRLARESGFFPPALVQVFEPVIQEEARHILFFVNWAAYQQARKPVATGVWFALRRFVAVLNRLWDRLMLARGADNNSRLSLEGHHSMGIDLSPASFLDLCLEENDRRMAGYDARLVRPLIVPRLVRLVRPLLGRPSAR